MAVAFVASSQTGTSDAFVTSLNVPVPSGAASGHIAIVAIEQWESANPTVTAPSGFTALTVLVSGSQKLKLWWKRLTGSDTGNYTFTWTGSQWSMGHCILISGGISSGDPVEATNTATATSTTIPSTAVTTLTEPFLGHFVANESAATATPPTNYTETRDGDYLHSNYRIPASIGLHTAASGTLSTSTLILAYLIAIKPESGAGSQTIVCNLLSTSSTIFSPQIIQTVQTSVLSNTSTIFSPSVSSIVQLPVTATSSTVFSPQVIQVVNTNVLANPSTVFSPGITAAVQVPLLSVPGSVFTPQIASDSITPQFLSTPSTIFDPSVVRLLQIIEGVLLTTSVSIFNPSIGGEVPELVGTISDIARQNMLADRNLTEPQLLSNVDLMRLILEDGSQTLVTETPATAAVHLWRYLKQVRDTV